MNPKLQKLRERRKKLPKYSFASRITRWVAGVVLLTMVLMMAFIYWVTSQVAEVQSQEFFQSGMRSSTREIDMLFRGVEIAMHNTLPAVEDNVGDADELNSIMRQFLSLNPTVKAVGMAFEPGFFPGKGRWYEPYFIRRSKHTAADTLEVEYKQLGGANHDYHRLPWYVKARATGEGSWTDPYVDSVGVGGVVCSYVQPVRDRHGDVVAVFLADITMGWLNQQLWTLDKLLDTDSFNGSPAPTLVEKLDSLEAADKEQAKRNMKKKDAGTDADADDDDDDEDERDYDIYGFIISRNGTYIAHPTDSLVLKANFFDNTMLSADTLDDHLGRCMIRGEEGSVEFDNVQRGGIHSFAFYTPIRATGWSMAVVVPEVWLKLYAYVLGVIIAFFMVLAMVALFIIMRSLIHRVARPLTMFSAAAVEVAQGHLDTPLPTIKARDEVGQLRDTFAAMQTSLQQQMQELRVSNEQRGRIEGELKVASDIQMSMLPKTFPPYPERDDIDIAGLVVPAKAVGGDLYDFYIRDEKLFFCIGDVSGKGVPASLLMAVTRSLFRTVSAHEASPERIVAHINETMSEQNDSLMFVTLFVGVLDLPTGRMRYANAGHDAPLLIGADVQHLPVDANIPVGVMRDWHFSQQEVCLNPGTTIFLYTDGLNEAENADHGQLGMERVDAVARRAVAAGHTPPAQLVEMMSRAVHDFVGDAEQSDDLTMLAIEYTKSVRQEIFEKSIVLDNDVQQVPQLAAFVDEVCEALHFDMGLAMQMNLAMEEAVVNVMNYAYPAGTAGTVAISAQANDVRLKFTIRDSGTPFDPTAKEEADTSLSAEERPIGGLGIYLVRQLMDSINYEYADGCNVLTLRKRLGPPPTPSDNV